METPIRMQTRNVPRLDALYWATLALASVFGTNTGDMISHTFRLGNYIGLPVLALAFAAILLAERRAEAASLLYYWIAIIVLRTGATNLGDLSTLQFELSYESDLAVLSALLVLFVTWARLRNRTPSGDRAPGGATIIDSLYWLAMLAAATLGTVLGDYGSHTLTLRVSTVVTVTCLAGILTRVRGITTAAPLYWLAIVCARTAGTNVGDLLAFRKGLNLGLPVSTLITGALFFGLVAWGSRRVAARTQGVLAGEA